VQEGANVTLRRAVVSENRTVGVLAASSATSLQLTDVRAIATRQRACAEQGCPPGGIGVGAYASATLEATRIEVAGAALTGLQLARGGTMTLQDSLIRDNPIGANVQTEEFDLARIRESVEYRNNDRNLDSTELPVPESGFE
jgi:hypothetical protein